MPDIKGSAKKALGGAAAAAAGAIAALKKMIAIPMIPPFMELAANLKNLISVKLIKEAIKKKIDAVKDILDPTKIKDQISGDKKTGIIASVMPRQVKELVKAYKQGMKLTPKEAITSTLEKFTGVNLDQDNLLQSLGGAVLDSINAQIDALKNTFMQTIVGCINKAVRDLLNKFPTLDFLINLEDRLNGILGKFRNQLEQKIDAELRGLMYHKIKIHQLTLFKQSLHGSIRSICPEATPASSAEVKAFMDAFEEGKKKREEAYEDKDRKNQIDDQGQANPKAIGEPTTRKSVTPKDERDWRTKPDIKMQRITDSGDDIMDATKKAVTAKPPSKNTVSSIVRRRSRLKGGARLMQLSKRRSEEPVPTAAGLRMKILPEGNRVLPNPPQPGY
tara:strand:- start:760 stop:1929 length:1170 start_codon:yes stop_codon:yes gene_type:complete